MNGLKFVSFLLQIGARQQLADVADALDVLRAVFSRSRGSEFVKYLNQVNFYLI